MVLHLSQVWMELFESSILFCFGWELEIDESNCRLLWVSWRRKRASMLACLWTLMERSLFLEHFFPTSYLSSNLIWCLIETLSYLTTGKMEVSTFTDTWLLTLMKNILCILWVVILNFNVHMCCMKRRPFLNFLLSVYIFFLLDFIFPGHWCWRRWVWYV